MNILYEDNSVIVINKPAGVASQSASISQKDCVSLIKNHLKANNPDLKGEPYVGVIHRLDQPVSGILVFAKNQKAAASLSKQVQQDIMNKKYYALVEGRIEDTGEVLLEDKIYKDSKNSKALIIKDGEGAPQNIKLQDARLKYKVKRYYNKEDVTLLDISLITGRFHQIRCQLSNLGHPIVNDRKYDASRIFVNDFSGEEMIIPKGIGLKAYELAFNHPGNKKQMIFTL